MKKVLGIVLLTTLLINGNAFAQEIIKKGINFGPLPVVAFDADKGFQYGALLNIYNFSDGSYYPDYKSKWYMEASFYTKGTQFYTLTYDSKHLIPGIRTSLAATLMVDKALDFYGFNGYQAYYDPSLPSMFYRMDRLTPIVKADFIGNLYDNKLFWEAGYYFSYTRTQRSDTEIPTLFDDYVNWGIIPKDQAKGGTSSVLRLGFVYDTRDREGAPTRGIWAEAHTMLSPSFLGSTHPYYRYALTFRQYIPLIAEQLVLAYRLNYQGTIGNHAPFYILPYLDVFGEGFNRDAVGGYRTVRGMMRNRIQGLDVAFFNAELRWRFVDFQLWNQNIAFGLNVFCDGGMTIRDYDMSYRAVDANGQPTELYRASYEAYRALGSSQDHLHLTGGAGLRFIMNQNFIVAFEYGKAFDRQDGKGSFYINTGYLF